MIHTSTIKQNGFALLNINYYHLQMKFAKVMFSQVSVCLPGVSTPLHAGIHPPGRYPPLAHNPQAHISPGHKPPGQTPPGEQFMLRYGQQAGSTHLIGMHSCFWATFQFSSTFTDIPSDFHRSLSRLMMLDTEGLKKSSNEAFSNQ